MERVTEGHFTPQSGRQSHVRIETSGSSLVLTSLDAEPGVAEDRSDLPSAHAKALLDVCPGTIVFDRSVLPLQTADALVERITRPGQLDVVSVEFATQADARVFSAPLWFGAEVTGDPAYLNWEIAISGVPRAPETELSNGALEAALDTLETIPLAAAHEGPRGAYAPSEDVDASEPLNHGDMVDSVVAMPTAAGLPTLLVEETTGDAGKPRGDRPLLKISPDPQSEGDERIASLFEDLAAAVSSSTLESVRSAAEVREERKWRWSSH